MKRALELFASRFAPPGDSPCRAFALSSLTGSADAFLALALTQGEPRVVLALTPGLPDADRLADDLRILTSSTTNQEKQFFDLQETSGSRSIEESKSRGIEESQDSQDSIPRILEFPPLITGDKSALGVRLKTIAALKAWGLSPYPCVVVASYPALACPFSQGSVPSIVLSTIEESKSRGIEESAGSVPVSFSSSSALSTKNQAPSTKFSTICEKLPKIGYYRVPMVEQEGDWSVRGGIIDVWSPGEEFPVRAEFFGEELESLRTFDAASQRSIDRIASATLLPIEESEQRGQTPGGECLVPDAQCEGEGEQRGLSPQKTLLDILPPNAAILALEHNAYAGEFLDSSISRFFEEPKSRRIEKSLAPLLIFTGDPAPRGVPTLPFQTAPLPGFAELGADEAHHPELFDAARQRLERHLKAAEARGDYVLQLDDLSGGFEIACSAQPNMLSQISNLKSQISQEVSSESSHETQISQGIEDETTHQSQISDLKDSDADLRFATGTKGARVQGIKAVATSPLNPQPLDPLPALALRTKNYELSTNQPGLLVVTKSDRVFAKKKTRVAKAAPTTGTRINDFGELEPGEYVVHVDYGVGRFIGSSEILTDGKRSEVFTIEYADGAKLHVPTAHAHLLSRYVGVKGEAVRVHRLDGKRWNKDKAAAQRAVADLAAALLETQAKRELVPGFAYNTACDGLDAFEAAFPYEETPDQSAAIAAIKSDLAARKPMDRLICGDAGYGKTEVAMRAAYIAALNGKQTAVLAPTTVLAEQHFETFTSRFDGTPVRIESVSRFQSTDTHKGTFQRLATGTCDIVIGTHAILSSKVAFHDLGLIIIDEEQRFGVRHKEFLKHLRATADVLTLSATPIPRTLYLSMTGARDLSLLRSPPRERVAVETTVVRDSDLIVRTAIESELARGGQIFFLHNRVMTIGKVEKRLKEILPRLRVVVAHGQMDARTLARKMRDFERGRYDLLLSTTIIESGIDIPRANTILVDQAHTFGLADLYQLRGRVGRSSKQGRAVFLLPPEGLVDSDARERLAALKRHGGLGSGFNLALRDLELRGAGNLLGSQQSGHIAAVGFGLYCQLLQRTIAAMKGETMREIVDVRLNLDFIDYSPASVDSDAAAALPYTYVEEDTQRMSFMKRFAEAMDIKAVNALSAELADRFGKLPSAARRLVRLAELRVRCMTARVTHIDVKGTRAVFYTNGSREVAFVRDLKGKKPDRKIHELISFVSA